MRRSARTPRTTTPFSPGDTQFQNGVPKGLLTSPDAKVARRSRSRTRAPPSATKAEQGSSKSPATRRSSRSSGPSRSFASSRSPSPPPAASSPSSPPAKFVKGTPMRIAAAVAATATSVLFCSDKGYNLDTPVAAAVLVLTVVCVLFILLTAPIPQDKAYHQFADQRGMMCACGLGSEGRFMGVPFLKIPNFGDVSSNFPFLLCGAYGAWLVMASGAGGRVDLASEWERTVAWPAFFASIGLTSLGSAYVFRPRRAGGRGEEGRGGIPRGCFYRLY